METWKDIDESANYQVSNMGRVRTKVHVIKKSNGVVYTAKEKVLKPAKDGSGYLRCAFQCNGKLTTFKVHRLVAKYFCAGQSNEFNEVNHKNGIKTDNRAANLEWVNRSQNVLHSFKAGLQKPKRGMLNGHSKLKDGDIPKIRELFNKGLSSRKIAEIYGMDKTIFLDIKNGKCWSHV